MQLLPLNSTSFTIKICIMTKLLVIAIFLSTLIALVSTKTRCPKEIQSSKNCPSNEYYTYVECLRGITKRGADCYEDDEEEEFEGSCSECNCERCASRNCDNTCNRSCCSSCCNVSDCQTNHCCHKYCHNSCKSQSCRSSCRKSCYKSVRKYKEEIVQQPVQPGNIVDESSKSLKSKHNITTVIHLNNVINNTNVIDVPINLNNTNTNKILLESSTNSTTSGQNCCKVVEPRQCVQTDSFPFMKCFHIRRNQCGDFCRAPVVHKVAQNVCFNTQQTQKVCGQQIMFVPQPQQRCMYQPQWPFVNCGVQSCSGCYNNFLNPYMPQVGCSPGCYQNTMFQPPMMNPLYFQPVPMMGGGCNGYNCGLYNSGMYPMDYGISNIQQGPLPIDQFIPVNLTSNKEFDTIIKNLTQNVPLITNTPLGYEGLDQMSQFSQFGGVIPITIDEETLEKLLKAGKQPVDTEHSITKESVDNTAIEVTKEVEPVVEGVFDNQKLFDTTTTIKVEETTKSFSLFG